MSRLDTKLNKKLIWSIYFVGFALICIFMFLVVKKDTSMGNRISNRIEPIVRSKTNIDIDTKESMIVIEVGGQYNLDYTDVNFESNDLRVATINSDGLIEGINPGTTSIVIKKGSKICGNIMVKVNEEAPTSPNTEDYFGENSELVTKDYTIETDALTKTLQETHNREIMVGPEQKKLTSETLYQLQKKKIKLTIDCIDYKLCIDGKDIDNHAKSFKTKVDFGKCNSGITMKLKSNDKLPGKVYVKLKNNIYKTKYIYGFNKELERYELISNNNKNEVLLSRGEKYLLTDNELYRFKIDSKYFILLGGVIVVLIFIYICFKKRYWFW